MECNLPDAPGTLILCSYVDWIVTGPVTAIWLGLIAGAETTDIVAAVAGNGALLSFAHAWIAE